MPISSSTQPSLKAKILSKFPARVVSGSAGLAIVKSGSLYTFSLSENMRTRVLHSVLTQDGGGALGTGVKGDLYIPFDCTLVSVTLLANTSGSITVDIWKDVLANYPPTVADTIVSGTLPTLSAAAFSQNSTLTDWTTTFSAGDVLRFNVGSVSGLSRVTVALEVLVGD